MRWGRDRNEEEELKDREMPMGSRGSIRSSSEQPHTDGGKLAPSAPSAHPHTNILQHSHTKSCFQLERHIARGEQRKPNAKKDRRSAVKKRAPLFPVRKKKSKPSFANMMDFFNLKLLISAEIRSKTSDMHCKQ